MTTHHEFVLKLKRNAKVLGKKGRLEKRMKKLLKKSKVQICMFLLTSAKNIGILDTLEV